MWIESLAMSATARTDSLALPCANGTMSFDLDVAIGLFPLIEPTLRVAAGVCDVITKNDTRDVAVWTFVFATFTFATR